MDSFDFNVHGERLPDMPDAEVYFYPEFMTAAEAERYFDLLLSDIPWQQDDIKVFNKVYAQPRLTALYGDNEKTYTYSGLTMQPKPFTPPLLELKKKIELHQHHTFTTCLLNLYRNGRDSNGWHADDEKELGTDPIIASLSLGSARMFKFRRKDHKKEVKKLELTSGSLLVMKGRTQHFWQHQIPKTTRTIGKRINLTFRQIK